MYGLGHFVYSSSVPYDVLEQAIHLLRGDVHLTSRVGPPGCGGHDPMRLSRLADLQAQQGSVSTGAQVNYFGHDDSRGQSSQRFVIGLLSYFLILEGVFQCLYQIIVGIYF